MYQHPYLRPIHRLSLALTLILATACSGHTFPPLNISKGGIQDSMLFLLLRGDSSVSLNESHPFKEEVLTLSPDTNLYKEAFVSFGRGDSLRYYRLNKGIWEQAIPSNSQDSVPKNIPTFATTDIDRKERNLNDIARGRVVAISFARLDNTMPNRSRLRKLDSLYKKDSLKHVYMYLSISDSLVRTRIKRDSLKGIAFSDTLGGVSLLRQQLGIARSNKEHTFVVDSTLRILKRL